MTGPIYSRIHQKLTAEFHPNLLEIYDDSAKHKGHAAMKGLNPMETHFRITLVSSKFENIGLVKRHQHVYRVLDQELKDGVHALQINAKTPLEYEK